MGMKVLVIGGTGLVGRFLLQRLVQKGCDIDVITRDPGKLTVVSEQIRPVVADLANQDWLPCSAVRLADYDVVYHLAYATSGNDAYDRSVTVDSVRTLVDRLRGISDGRSRHFVYTGSMVVFGAHPPDRTVTEASAKNGDTPYAENKIAATMCAMAAAPGLFCTVLHPTGVYAEHSSRINSYRALLAYNYVPTQLSKRSINSIVYADDVAAALWQCLDRPRDRLAEEYIINGETKLFVEWFSELSGTVRSRTWVRLPPVTRHICRGRLRRLLNAVGVGCPLPFAEKKGSVFERETLYSSDKARKHFGFAPQTSFRQVCERLRAEEAG
jgi:nucleoside-diphosphate-sugar epimerase